MKRRITIILLLVAGGAIVNIAVAWGCAVMVFRETYLRTIQVVPLEPMPSRFQPHWFAAFSDEAIGPNVEPHVMTSVLWPKSGFGFQRWEVADIRHGWLYVEEAGWPMYSLLDVGSSNNEIGTAWRIQWPWDHRVLSLPLRPYWPGFIINTLFYALLLWLLFFAPFTARRALRRRRGQCEKCAYPVGARPVCTECGAAVTRKTQA